MMVERVGTASGNMPATGMRGGRMGHARDGDQTHKRWTENPTVRLLQNGNAVSPEDVNLPKNAVDIIASIIG